ncbi:MAG: hypothetical protein IT200_10845 [Thermoleophilia bacterium]|nr:hypothetical protein [Thermoleophilia bacterium]
MTTTWHIRVTDLMSGAREVAAFEARTSSVDDLRARCRHLRGEAGEAIHVEAVRTGRLRPPRTLAWAVA